jgi:hypothetical protein
MGLSTKKQSSTETTNQNTTMNTTPTNPEWVTQGISGLADKINSTFGGLDPSKLVAPANPLQNLAGTTAGGLTGSPWNYDAAADLTRGVANANAPQTSYVDSSGLIDKFMNPYQDNVLKSSLAEYDYGAGQQRAQQQAAKARDSVFGGSGGAVGDALLGSKLAMDRGNLADTINSQGFTTALGAAQSEAARHQAANDLNAQLMGQGQDRTLGAAKQLTDISSGFDANQRANATTQAGIGGTLRDVTNQQLQAPIQTLLQQIAAYGGLPLDLFKGSNSTGTLTGTTNTTGKTSGAGLGDWLNFFASNAKAAANAGAGGG